MAEPGSGRWERRLAVELPAFLADLAVTGQVGRYRPCRRGATPQGRAAALGFSCFALKLEYMLGLWQRRDDAERAAWVAFLQSFQNPLEAAGEPWRRGAFVDPALDRYFQHFPLTRRLVRLVRGGLAPAESLRRAVIAETKQAIATLAEVGASALHPYQGFPTTVPALREQLAAYSWTKPWAAGGQTSAFCVFAVAEAPRWLPADEAEALRQVCRALYAGVADPETGAYYAPPRPEMGQLVNGAMKVLTALDWLDEPIHHPEALLATALTQQPEATGCHVVDWIYVIYRCVRQIGAVSAAARDGVARALAGIEAHWHDGGGFSYHPGASQTGYYGLPIARGLDEADIHGTILLTWAVIMALWVLDGEDARWRVIRP